MGSLMHSQARDFIAGWRTNAPVTVAEIGSKNINGSVRDLFPNASWTGLDIRPGPDVDVVANPMDWSPPALVDFVITCEVLEHTVEWALVVLQGWSWLKPGGWLLITCAGPGRGHHSAVDGCSLRPNEYYANISTDHIRALSKFLPGLDSLLVCSGDAHPDTYAALRKTP